MKIAIALVQLEIPPSDHDKNVDRKINLWEIEKATLTPGALVSVFPTAFGLVGITICWDISFPMLFTEMVKQGVRLVISAIYWYFPKSG